MSQTELDKLELFEHFSIFAYPFLHNAKNNQQTNYLTKLSKNWQSWWSRIETDEDLAYTLDNTYFFLPYIRKLIFPETNLLSPSAGKKYSHWVSQIRNLSNRNLVEINDLLPSRSILRLTLKQDSLSQFQSFTFPGKNEKEINANILWIDSILFPSGIGFLLFKIKLAEDSLSLNNLIQLNQSFRSIHPTNINQNLPKFNFKECMEKKLTARQLIEKLLDGFVSNQEKYVESAVGQIYGERCQLFSFAGVGFEQSALKNLDYGNFGSLENLLLYEYATCTNLYDSVCQTQWKPSKNQIEEINKNLISTWECWSGLAIRDSVVFLASVKNEFNQFSLPYIIEDDYFPLYFYSLYQKYQLYLFSDQLMQKGIDLKKNLDKLRSLTNSIFTFRNRYWFNEVTRKSLGNEIYKKIKYGLGIFEAYDLVNHEVADLKSFYEENQNRRIKDAITVLTFVFVPLSAVIGFWGMNFVQDGSWYKFLLSAGFGLILPYLFYRIWSWWKYEK
jgi:CorA-like Mg2+ transporter protein